VTLGTYATIGEKAQIILVQMLWECLPPTETRSHKDNGPTLWLNCKQPCIATSTTESEYVVASHLKLPMESELRP
jgi:hypothetical protein